MTAEIRIHRFANERPDQKWTGANGNIAESYLNRVIVVGGRELRRETSDDDVKASIEYPGIEEH